MAGIVCTARTAHGQAADGGNGRLRYALGTFNDNFFKAGGPAFLGSHRRNARILRGRQRYFCPAVRAFSAWAGWAARPLFQKIAYHNFR